MGCTALAFDNPLRELRNLAHKQLDQMAPLFQQDKPPTLLDRSRHSTQTRTTLLGGVL